MTQPAPFSFYFALLISFLAFSCTENKEISLSLDTSIPQVAFARESLTQALSAQHYEINQEAKFRIRTALDSSCCEKEGFKIVSNDKETTINAADANGLMYGVLELAELIAGGEKLNSINVADKPYIVRRGIKFNIPLDARTNTFDDGGDAAQKNIAEMWNLDFWKQFFDNMARNRYNAISFWNAHPFSSMVKLEDYGDVALNNVCGTSIDPQKEPGAWLKSEMPSKKIMENLVVLKEISIDDKIKFWQEVMAYAKSRGIEVYFITWNICLNGAAPPGDNEETVGEVGKYGITNDFKNPISIDYMRKSVKQFILTYPDLTGIGVTAGENMRTPMVDEDREKWLWDTYGEGIMDAKREHPQREVRFIHRFWWTDAEKVMKYWGNYPDSFEMSFKYSKGHMYSGENPPFANPLLEWMAPLNLKSWWNMRNDDIYMHRWGDPEFASAYIKNMPLEQTAGYHMGSDGYCWGREFISKNPDNPRQLEIDKHWYQFLLWGRMGYNPDIPNDRFISIIQSKFPDTDASILFTAWQNASKIIPQVTKFHWRDWDYHWQPELCMSSGGKGFQTVEHFINNPTMEGSGIINIKEYNALIVAKQSTDLVTPEQIANRLTLFAASTLEAVGKLNIEANNKELNETFKDIEAMAYLGDYYSHKIRGAISLEFFKLTGDEKHREEAVQHLTNASVSWKKYKEIDFPRYDKQFLSRLNKLADFEERQLRVDEDIDLAINATTYANN